MAEPPAPVPESEPAPARRGRRRAMFAIAALLALVAAIGAVAYASGYIDRGTSRVSDFQAVHEAPTATASPVPYHTPVGTGVDVSAATTSAPMVAPDSQPPGLDAAPTSPAAAASFAFSDECAWAIETLRQDSTLDLSGARVYPQYAATFHTASEHWTQIADWLAAQCTPTPTWPIQQCNTAISWLNAGMATHQGHNPISNPAWDTQWVSAYTRIISDLLAGPCGYPDSAVPVNTPNFCNLACVATAYAGVNPP